MTEHIYRPPKKKKQSNTIEQRFFEIIPTDMLKFFSFTISSLVFCYEVNRAICMAVWLVCQERLETILSHVQLGGTLHLQSHLKRI